MSIEGGTEPFDRDRAIPYKVGLCFASVCAPLDMPIEQVEADTNSAHPTGLDHGWKLSDSPEFLGGQSNPCPCEHDPARQHWLLSC